MLKTRIITALCLLLVFMPSLLWADEVVFAWVMILPLSAAAWEWARLNNGGMLARVPHFAVLYAALFFILCIALDGPARLALMLGEKIWQSLLLMWALVSVLTLTGGQRAWQRLPVMLRMILGWCILGGAWLALIQIRAASLYYLFSILLSVWLADIGAYFGGRTFGGRLFRRRLAPAISPNKTWEGALVAVIVVLWFSISTWQWGLRHATPPGFFGLAMQAGGWLLALPATLLLVTLAIVGDLQESMMKRLAGVKDSSWILPGHGGVLDRFDALLPVLPLAMVFLRL